MSIERFPASSAGRSRAVALETLVWAVSNASDPRGDFSEQARSSLANLDDTLRNACSDRSLLVSVQVFLSDLANKPLFDQIWNEWIGPLPDHWPQRVCIEAGLSSGLLVELQAVAVRGDRS